jgi:hypothetical protein
MRPPASAEIPERQGRDNPQPPVPEGLAPALSAWVDRAEPAPLLRWLGREIDPEGVPRRLPVAAWGPCLAALANAFRVRPTGWPAPGTDRIEAFFRTALRFRRSDGSAVFGPASTTNDVGWLRFWADWLPDPRLGAVVLRWFPASRGQERDAGVPPLPTFGSRRRPLAMLRPDWTARGDLLAIDQRDPLEPCLLELVGGGRLWLGPSWVSDREEGPRSPAQLLFWSSGALADVVEWSFRTASARIIRTAVLLRGRQLALLAEQVEGPGAAATLRVAAGPGVEPHPLTDLRALSLEAGRGRPARVLPLGLPPLPYSTERGSWTAAAGECVLRQRQEGRRCWLPLLVSWRGDRNRRPTFWRTLTVSERSRICPPDVAVGIRVAWGTGEGLLIYRSLARPALRTVLGYQTRARFLIGALTKTGHVEPILRIEGGSS